MFNHNAEGGEFFANFDDALKKNENNPTANLYSILNKLETFRISTGKFRLKLCFPQIVAKKHCNEWFQSSNPATHNTIEEHTFEALSQVVSIIFSKTHLTNEASNEIDRDMNLLILPSTRMVVDMPLVALEGILHNGQMQLLMLILHRPIGGWQ